MPPLSGRGEWQEARASADSLAKKTMKKDVGNVESCTSASLREPKPAERLLYVIWQSPSYDFCHQRRSSAERLEPYIERQARDYSADIISIDFRGDDFDEVMRFLSDAADREIVTDARFTGALHFKLTDVPWDQALDVVLALYGLRFENAREDSPGERRKYRDLRNAIEAERDEIVSEGRRRKQVHDAVTAGLREAFRILKNEREAQGLSLADMQERTGMSRSALSRLESHDSANPTIETLSRYAEALGKQLPITLTDKAS